MSIETRPFLESGTGLAVTLREACGLTRPWNDPRMVGSRITAD